VKTHKSETPDKDHRGNQEFFEAMPGTLDRTHLDHTDLSERSSEAERRSILPWLLIPLAILLALALISALANNAGTNTQTAPGLQQDQGLD
jgi:hypothetical protein